MFSTGSCGSLHPKRFAVAGISCIKPCAPACERACTLYFDSCQMTAWMKRGSTPCFSPASKMIRSNSASPDVGMSAGMRNAGSVLAMTSGAITRLNSRPVRLLNMKREISAKGANLIERNRGNLRGNFIQFYLHIYDDHDATRYSTYADARGLHRTNSQDFLTASCNEGHDSDGTNTAPVAFSFQFCACKLLKTLYLFAPPWFGHSEATVIVTEKTRHSWCL